MNLKTNILLTIFSLIFCCVLSHSTETKLINYLIKGMKHKHRVPLVTIHSQMPQKLSSISIRFIQKIANEYPTLAINTTELTNASNNQRLNGVKKWLYTRSHRKSLNVIIIDNDQVQNAEDILIEYVTILTDLFLNTTRPQCIFFLVNHREKLKLREFFKFSWSHKFLDVLVVEILKPATGNLIHSPTDNLEIIMHQYNPFNLTHHRTTLAEQVKERKLFIYKLYDFHGYTLRTGMFIDIPMVMLENNYTGNDVWGIAQGLDVVIIRALAKKLNFKATLKVISSNNTKLKRFNVTNNFMIRALINEQIDFAVNFFSMLGNKRLEDLPFETSIFAYPYSSNLIVKQEGKPVIKLSNNIIIISSVVVTTIISFSIIIRILRLSTKTWSTYNIIKILAGITIPAKPEKIYEKVLFLSLTVISAAMSVNILEQLLDMYMWQDIFPELHYLQDVIEAGIVPSITSFTKRLIPSYNHKALQKVLNYSTTIASEGFVSTCIEPLVNQKNVNGCEVISIVGQLVSQSFSDKNRGWIISFVEEPIVPPCWTAMALTKTSPYVLIFNRILRRFSESGFLMHWFHSTVRNFTFMHKNFFVDMPLHEKNPLTYARDYFIKTEKTPLNKKVILILVIGHAASCLIFVGEFISKYYQQDWSRKRERKFIETNFNKVD